MGNPDRGSVWNATSGDAVSDLWGSNAGSQGGPVTGNLNNTFTPVVAFSPSLGPGGARVAWNDGSEITVGDLESARLPLRLSVGGKDVNDARFGCSGTCLVVAPSGSSVAKFDLGNRSDFSGATTVINPDGTRVATGGVGESVEIWDPGGKKVSTLPDTSQTVPLAFDQTGTRILTLGKAVKVWNVATGQPIVTVATNESVSAASLSPDGTRIVTAGQGVKLWDAASGQQISQLGNEGEGISTVPFSPDGRLINTGTADVLTVWDAVSGRRIHALSAKGEANSGADFSPDGAHLLTVGNDRAVNVWDFQSDKSVTLDTQDPTTNQAWFLPGGSRVITTGDDGKPTVWDTAAGKKILTLPEPIGSMSPASFSPDGRYLLGVAKGLATMWDLATGQKVHTAEAYGGVLSAVFSPDGRRVAVIGESAVTVLDAPTWTGVGPPLQLAHVQDSLESTDSYVVAFTADGKKLETSLVGSAEIWDLEFQSPSGPKQVIPRSTLSAFSPDGTSLATADGPTATVYEILSSKQRFALPSSGAAQEQAPSNLVALSWGPKGLLATASKSGTVTVWDLSNGTPRSRQRSLPAGGSQAGLAFSADGRLLAMAEGTHVEVWDHNKDKVVWGTDGKAVLTGVAMSPDGKLLATTDRSGSVVVWDRKKRRQMHSYPAYAGHLTSVSFGFGPHSHYLAALGDGGLVVWDSDSQTEWLRFTEPARSFAFSPDGGTLAIAWQGTTRLLDLDLDNVKAMAKEPSHKPTTAQCLQYVGTPQC
jgi:WD40 repeat protein